jgi:hypothetical protein
MRPRIIRLARPPARRRLLALARAAAAPLVAIVLRIRLR